jgi:Protein of unknown function (DUF3891)
MIVTDAGEAWQVVLQTDHAALAGEIARAFGGDGFAPPTRPASVEIAARRHDDGWRVWESAPLRDPSGAPKHFYGVPAAAQLDFYRCCIAAVEDEDPYAALLVSMHGAGVFGGDYGWRGAPVSDELAPLAGAFVAEQEARYAGRAAAAQVSEAERWSDHDIVQVADRISIVLSAQTGTMGPATIEKIVRADRSAEPLVMEPEGEWTVTLAPYPFAEAPARFSLLRRLIPKQEWPDDEAFRATFFATGPERVEITILPA